MTQINDANSARLKSQKATDVANAAPAATTDPGRVQVVQGNVPLLTVQLLDMIVAELRKMNALLEKMDG